MNEPKNFGSFLWVYFLTTLRLNLRALGRCQMDDGELLKSFSWGINFIFWSGYFTQWRFTEGNLTISLRFKSFELKRFWTNFRIVFVFFFQYVRISANSKTPENPIFVEILKLSTVFWNVSSGSRLNIRHKFSIFWLHWILWFFSKILRYSSNRQILTIFILCALKI